MDNENASLSSMMIILFAIVVCSIGSIYILSMFMDQNINVNSNPIDNVGILDNSTPGNVAVQTTSSSMVSLLPILVYGVFGLVVIGLIFVIWQALSSD